MDQYRTHSLEGASGVELTIAFYDGIVRFLYRAIEAVERGDADQRRAAVKRAMDIVIHLQATLKMDIGGKPAEALSEFYTAIFALMLQASQANSSEKFQHAIDHVRNVRDAWKQVAKDIEARPPVPQTLSVSTSRQPCFEGDNFGSSTPAHSNWNA